MNANITKDKQPEDLKQKGLRNSLLELYRFLFAMWVVWYHGYFLFSNQFFNHGYMAVEFFFILSGFYLLKNLNKFTNAPFFRGLLQMLWSKIKPLGLPLIIGLIFVLWQRILAGKTILMGYLWYIPIMLLAFSLIYTLKRLIKNNLAFILTLVCIVIASYLILYIPVIEKFGVARGLGAVSLGVLISLIPKKIFKIKKFNFNLLLTILILAATLILAYLPKNNLISEYFLVLLLMPALIYFTSTLNISSKFLNFLGSLSFPLYVYQCVLKVLKTYFTLNQVWWFVILISLVILSKIITCFIHHKRHKNLPFPV